MYDELKSAATTAAQNVTKVVQSTTLPGGLSSVGGAVANLQKAASNGLTNLGSNVLSSVAGQALGAIGALQQKLSSIVNLGNLTNVFKSMASVSLPVQLPMPNVLHSYASYNYVFTLSVLSSTQINFPNDTYKKGDVGQIILKSGSGDPDNRVNTAYGKFDFFMDNLQINSVIGLDKDTGNTNATGIRFKVTEPYSMGLFFQALQLAAQNAGYANYMDVPILLTIEFKGHLNSEVQGITADSLSIEKTTKHIPMRVRNIDMKVTGRGAEYDVDCFPWNEKGFSSTFLELKSDFSISGETVNEMLQTGKKSLQRALNDRLQGQKDKGIVRVPDQILIMFPEDLSTGPIITNDDEGNPLPATINPSTSVNPNSPNVTERLGVKVKEDGNGTLVQDEEAMNPIGRASMGFNLYRPGDPPFAKDDLAYDEKTNTYTRGKVNIKPTEGEFKFPQGTDIINAINQVILMSDYGRQALKSSQVGESGKLTWWRIESQVYDIPSNANMSKTGTTPKLIVYRVVPFAIDASSYMPVNTPNPKVNNAKKQAVKEYNYIYTGKNLDILNFDIQFKAGFYQALNADAGKNNEGTDLAKKTGSAAPVKTEESGAPPSGGSKPLAGEFPTERRNDQIKTDTGTGGGGRDTPETIAARQFQSAVLKGGADMLRLNMTILGDPYFLGDSGMGNYTAGKTQYENINSDYSVDYQTGEVDVVVNFRTPIDINMSKGAYDFGPTTLINQFSGLYMVQRVENSFTKGRFTQNLTMVRRIGQTSDEAAASNISITPVLATGGSDNISPAVYEGSTQYFDDGSAIQTFDDGSQLVTDSDGNLSSVPATDGIELRTQSEITASQSLAGFDG